MCSSGRNAVLAQHLFDLDQLLHGGGADIGALGVAKEHHHHFAAEVLQAALLAVVVGQWNIAGVVGPRDVHTAKFGLFVRTSA